MPNWCHNTLTVSGDEGEVDRFIKENQGRASQNEFLSFAKSVPEPTYQEYDDGSQRLTKEGLLTWYDWRVENWGTKWEPSIEGPAEEKIVESVKGKTKIATYSFDTAWGPGDVWFEKITSKYKSLKLCLTYGEVGSGFGGAIIADQGKIVSQSEGGAEDYLPEDMRWF
jgi:hypothetical protein